MTSIGKSNSLFNNRSTKFIELGGQQDSPLEFKSQPSEEMRSEMTVAKEAKLEEAKRKTMLINNEMGNQQLLEIAKEKNDTQLMDNIE